MKKIKKHLKKYVALLLIIFTVFTTIPLTAFAADMNLGDKQNKTNIPISYSMHYGHELHTTTVDGETYPLFCIEYGKSSPDSSILASQGVPSDAKVLEAARWIFAGYYMVHGNSINWLDMAYCQKKVWSVLGSETSWNFSNEGYNAWVSNAQNNMKSLNTYPSFHNKNINEIIGNIVAGTSKTITDTNGVLKDYPAFTQDSNGVKIVHDANSNTITITVDKNCTQTSFYFLNNRYFKSITGDDKNCLLYNPGSGGTQKLLYSAYYDPISLTFSGSITPLGDIEITKQDNYGAAVDGAEFGLFTDKGCTNRIATTKSENGLVKFNDIAPSTYYVKEIKAPDGFLLSDVVTTVTVNSNQTSRATVKNEEPTGNIEITKKLDVSKTDNKYGDIRIDEAEYTLYAAEKITNKAGTKVFYNKGDAITSATIKASSDGKTGTIKFENLPLGKYMIKETANPTGTFIDETEHFVTLSYKDQNTALIIDSSTVSVDLVKSMKVKIFKAGTDGSPGQVQGLPGAEFTIKLKSDYDKAIAAGYTYEEIWAYQDNETWYGIDQYGNRNITVSQERAAAAQQIAPNYDKITTNESGVAVSKFLPYGKYIAKETLTPKDFTSGSDFTFSIKADESEFPNAEDKVIYIVVNNAPVEYPVKIVKKDAESGKTVTLNSATFKIKATEDIFNPANGELEFAAGEYVGYKVGSATYNEFMTNSDGFVVPAEPTYGSINDDKGSVTTPFKLPAGKYEVVEIVAPNGFISPEDKYEFEISTIYDYDEDKDGDPIVVIEVKNTQPKGRLEVTKKINLREGMDTSLIEIDFTKIKFELVAAKNIIDKADGSVIYEEGQRIGEYSLNSEGKLVIDNLWMGEYYLCETATLDGCILDTTRHKVVFEPSDTTTKKYTVTLNIQNETTEVDFTKTDVTGQKELPGAKLTVIDKNGKVVDSWISSDVPHKIEGLKVGETYTLKEETAPNGFVVAQSIKFTISNTAEIQIVKMIDKQVSAIKKDPFNNVVTGAELTVTNKATNKVVDVWETTTEEHYINNLVEGETYILSETKTPEGFVKAQDVEFTVTSDKEIQYVEMVDKQVYALKIDAETGNPLPGAELRVIDESGNEIDRWITDSGLHYISGLVEGEKYILEEVLAPDEFAISVSIPFEVTTDKQNQVISMSDKRVEVTKNDVDGAAIVGAELVVTNTRTKQIVDRWTTTEEPHYVSNLIEGETYILSEVKTPEGFVTAQDVEFTVTSDKETQYVEMVDKRVSAVKIDKSTDKVLEGAKLAVLDNEGNIVDEWISSKEAHYINGLKEGNTYILRELEAPIGFQLAEDMKFTVTEDKETMQLTMYDIPIYSSVRVEKIDSATGEHIVSNKFEFTIYEDAECTKPIETKGANTDQGTALFENLKYGIYYIKETKAPLGYELSNQIVKIEINQTGVYADGKCLNEVDGVYSFVYLNSLLPEIHTGENSKRTMMFITMGGIAILGIVGMIYIKKRSNK